MQELRKYIDEEIERVSVAVDQLGEEMEGKSEIKTEGKNKTQRSSDQDHEYLVEQVALNGSKLKQLERELRELSIRNTAIPADTSSSESFLTKEL